MPLLSSHALLHASSLTLLSASYALIFTPATLLQSTTLTLLGSSMHIPPASYVPNIHHTYTDTLTSSNPLYSLGRKTTLTQSDRELLALLGLFIGLFAITQSVLALSLRYNKSEISSKRADKAYLGETIRSLTDAQNLWMTVAAVRVVLTTVLTGWIYVFRNERREDVGKKEGWGLLANHVGFGVALVDMLFWGYVYTVVKEERREVGGVLAIRQKEEEEDEMMNSN